MWATAEQTFALGYRPATVIWVVLKLNKHSNNILLYLIVKDLLSYILNMLFLGAWLFGTGMCQTAKYLTWQIKTSPKKRIADGLLSVSLSISNKKKNISCPLNYELQVWKKKKMWVRLHICDIISCCSAKENLSKRSSLRSLTDVFHHVQRI